MLGMEILVIIGLILLLLVLWIISVQRKFAVMDGNIQNAMNQIGVQISSRFDALFAVLDLMKGYAADDIQPLMERAAARRSVITARSAPEEVSEQEQVIEETVKSIRLAAERNPLLCADKNYTKCMDAVECYGRMVYTSRLIYNDSVTKLNSALGMFPTNVIAGILGFHKREYLSQKGINMGLFSNNKNYVRSAGIRHRGCLQQKYRTHRSVRNAIKNLSAKRQDRSDDHR